MTVFRKIATLATTAFLMATFATTTAAETATQDIQATAGYSDFCATGRVSSLADRLPIRTAPYHSASLISTAYKGYQYNCWVDHYSLGDRYTACGVSNANGWLIIVFNDGRLGWTYMTCLKDV
jgi:hypothetical protein